MDDSYKDNTLLRYNPIQQWFPLLDECNEKNLDLYSFVIVGCILFKWADATTLPEFLAMICEGTWGSRSAKCRR
jgi:hypothetical protein